MRTYVSQILNPLNVRIPTVNFDSGIYQGTGRKPNLPKYQRTTVEVPTVLGRRPYTKTDDLSCPH